MSYRNQVKKYLKIPTLKRKLKINSINFQSFLFREGANPGFHEGVADILGLAVGTAGYYKRLGLLSQDVDEMDPETNINILFNAALGKLVFMPFGYLVDKYRWDLYSGWADEHDMNCHWVKLRIDIQGLFAWIQSVVAVSYSYGFLLRRGPSCAP